MDPRIKTILESAILAPSGDNCQPWKVSVDGLRVDLFNDSDRDRSLYNLEQRASLIAHGAFLENLELAARSCGLESHVELLPDSEDENHIAKVILHEASEEKSELCEAIALRCTNRSRYQPVNISDRQIEHWQKLAAEPTERIWVARDKEQIDRLAELLSLNDRLVFEVPALHQFLFAQLRWTDQQAHATGDGLDIKTLGLNPVDRLFFKFFKSRSIVSFLNQIGLSRIIQFKAAKLIKSSSALAIITLADTRPLDYIQGGRIWQRLLLQLAAQDLAAQPIAGLACLMQSAHEGALSGVVEDRLCADLLEARQAILQCAGRDDSATILTVFRIGRGVHVTRALRRPLGAFLRQH